MKHVSTMSQLLETTMTYAGNVRDYENCNATTRNIEPDCNLFNKIMNKYNPSENEFLLMHLNIRSLPKNIGKLCEYLSLIDNKFTIIWFKRNLVTQQ